MTPSRRPALLMWPWLPVVGALLLGAIGAAIGWTLAADDLYKVGDWRRGGLRFIGMCGAIGVFVGFFVTRRLQGRAVTRDGFTLVFERVAPKLDGYRDVKTVTVADLAAALAASGYAPAIRACDATGEARGAIDPTTPLAGANLAIRDPGVRGWIRLQLAPPLEEQQRSLEIWSQRGDSTEELALFTLRALGGLVDGLSASRESSQLSADPVALLTAGLADRPVHRRDV